MGIFTGLPTSGKDNNWQARLGWNFQNLLIINWPNALAGGAQRPPAWQGLFLPDHTFP